MGSDITGVGWIRFHVVVEKHKSSFVYRLRGPLKLYMTSPVMDCSKCCHDALGPIAGDK